MAALSFVLAEYFGVRVHYPFSPLIVLRSIVTDCQLLLLGFKRTAIAMAWDDLALLVAFAQRDVFARKYLWV